MDESEESVFTSLAINAFESELYDYHLHTKILITASYKQLKYIELPMIWISNLDACTQERGICSCQ